MTHARYSAFVWAAFVGLATIGNVHAAKGKGLTIGVESHDAVLGIDRLSVHVAPGGNPFEGDTSCKAKRPVLCLKRDGSRRPPYHVDAGREVFNGWVEGHFMTTKPVKGTSLTSKAAGDLLCAGRFRPADPTWRMAEYRDSRFIPGMDENNFYDAAPQSTSPWPTGVKAAGSQTYFGYSNLGVGTRVWMAVDNTAGNCWSP